MSHRLAWTIAFILVAAASLAQGLWLAGVRHEALFRLWYLAAVNLVLVSVAIGMALLLLPVRPRALLVGLLLVLGLAAVALDLSAPLRADVAVLGGGLLHAKQPGTNESFYPGQVEGLTFFLSLIAGLTLLGGALYAVALVLFRRAARRGALSIVLITFGAMAAQEGGVEGLAGFAIAFIGLALGMTNRDADTSAIRL